MEFLFDNVLLPIATGCHFENIYYIIEERYD
jgi:hypothetical protein